LIHAQETGSDLPVRIRRILVPLDGSDFSDQILANARELATTTRSELILLTIVQPIMAAAAAGLGEPSVASPAPIGLLPTDADAVKEETNWLESKAAELRSSGLVVKSAVLVHGNAGHAIVDYAKDHSADVIAMSTHGRGAVKRLLMGSVATDVFRRSSAATLLYRPRLH
jgi:nucleotide-binding universal stress UspA family protein